MLSKYWSNISHLSHQPLCNNIFIIKVLSTFFSKIYKNSSGLKNYLIIIAIFNYWYFTKWANLFKIFAKSLASKRSFKIHKNLSGADIGPLEFE